VGDEIFVAKTAQSVPHEFVLEAIGSALPITRPMFGCLAVYIADKTVFILCDKHDSPGDNGVWLATTKEHHDSSGREFPRMRSIRVFGKDVTGWQVMRRT
jgi:hypothetical protein